MIPDELVTRLQYIEIYTRKAARHHWVADYRSPLRGRGFEFDQHKPYQQGDDYRQIDWNATARMPQPYIRKAYEEKEMNAVILADLPARWNLPPRTSQAATPPRSVATRVFSAINDDRKVGLLGLRTRLKSTYLRKRGWRRSGRFWRPCGMSAPVRAGRTCFGLWTTWVRGCGPPACCFVFRILSPRKRC